MEKLNASATEPGGRIAVAAARDERPIGRGCAGARPSIADTASTRAATPAISGQCGSLA